MAARRQSARAKGRLLAGNGARDGQNITNVVTLAVGRTGYTNALAAQLTRDALLRNWKIAANFEKREGDFPRQATMKKVEAIREGIRTQG